MALFLLDGLVWGACSYRGAICRCVDRGDTHACINRVCLDGSGKARVYRRVGDALSGMLFPAGEARKIEMASGGSILGRDMWPAAGRDASLHWVLESVLSSTPNRNEGVVYKQVYGSRQ